MLLNIGCTTGMWLTKYARTQLYHLPFKIHQIFHIIKYFILGFVKLSKFHNLIDQPVLSKLLNIQNTNKLEQSQIENTV